MALKRRVFVTGAGGTIGRSVAKVLVARGYHVVGFGLGEQFYRQSDYFKSLHDSGAFTFETGSILDRAALPTAMKGADAVIHLAAMVGGRRTEDERLRCLDINVNGTDNVLAAAVMTRASRFLTISSSAVYGEPLSNPVIENAERKPLNVYGISKLAAEELTRGYAQLYPDLRTTILRLFNSYGDDLTGHIALNAFAARVVRGEAPRINDDGEHRRCYVHADDVADAVVSSLESSAAENKLYNIGNPAQVFTLNTLARKVIDILAPDSGLLPEYSGVETRDVREIVADTTCAERDFGFRPQITVDEGLRRIARGRRADVS